MRILLPTALLALGLTAGLQSCTTSTSQELAPATSPKALKTAKFVLDEDP